ncbi:hypothetical protein GGS20DRAFT_578673 [Poronia punctata]|nr:hypothetical protein GGS20DRAFT_578673 [Poronia punctata]
MGNNKMWYQGDAIPPAYDPCKDDREEKTYSQALDDPNRCYGIGTEEDPLVIWMNSSSDKMDRDMLWANNNFAKAIAKILGFTHAWIIKEAHGVEYARDAKGRKIPTSTSPNRYLLQEADMHITLRLGTGLYDCRLSAHAYVQLDDEGCPETYMTDLVRRYRKHDGDSQIEFWPWRNAHRRTRPRKPMFLCQMPNWEVHANVGPYLDTYRPDNRWAGDTYTPRKPSTPPREESDSGSDIIEGTLTEEMSKLMTRCKSTYDSYKEMHREVMALGDPPVDRLRQLQAVRERFYTMKREIYREVRGILV